MDLTGSKVAFCFKGPYRPGSENDCILIPQGGVTNGYLGTEEEAYNDQDSYFHFGVPDLIGSASCYVYVITQSSDGSRGVSVVQIHQCPSEYLS